MYGGILRQLRESTGRSQADVARTSGISPAHLARLEANQRGLYVEDFVRITEVLGEKPGNLLPNSLGEIAHLKPLIDRFLAIQPELLPSVAMIVGKIVTLMEQVEANRAAAPTSRGSVPLKRPAASAKTRE